MWPPGWGRFWPQGYSLNKLGRRPLDNASYQISWLLALWFQTRRIFHVHPYISLFKACDPWNGAIFGPRGIIWTSLVDVHRVTLHTKHTKYQGSRPYGFRQEDFFMILPIKVNVKHMTPRRGHFWPQGHNLKNLIEVHRVMLYTEYQSSRPYGFRQEV